MTGFTREELLTKSCMELTIDEDKKKNEKVLETTLKDGYVENFEKSCVTKDNRIIRVNMSIALMPDNQRLLISTKNITQNKLLESQAKLASMGEMIGNIAHQWRQPLSVINLLASTIAFKQENQTLKENDIIPNMEKIITQSSYLSKTIDDFRNFIKSSDEKSTINLSSVLEKTFSIVNPTLSNNYIKTILDIDKTLEIEGFENGLMQVFINIINNSKDALNENLSQTSKKYIFISIHKRDDKIEVIFKDNAGGIKEDILNRIFEPYFTTKHQSQGTGLGLSMAYTIINERHNGIIEAKNETFQYEENTYTGACVTISFVA
jgi:signal transduction histidine kinase